MTAIVLWMLLAASPPKADARLTMSPQITVWDIMGREIRGTVEMTNIDEKYWCPRIEWYWSDGSVETEEGDCDPFDQSTASERERSTVSKTHRFYGHQVVTLVVRIVKAGKLIKRLEGSVEIH